MSLRCCECHTLAKAHDLDSVRHLEHVRHVVTDECDRQPAVTYGSNDIETHINSWDCLGALAVIQAAGGTINDFLAGDGLWQGNRVIAGPASLYPKLELLFEAGKNNEHQRPPTNDSERQ